MSAAEQPVVHTPGPWEVREHEGLFAIAHPTGWVLESNEEQQDRADARLIAAAPDLLAALNDLLCELPRHSGGLQAKRIVAARDAIEKATGKPWGSFC